MINITYKWTPDVKKIVEKIGSISTGGIRAGMINLVEDIEARAVKLAPVRTSNLVNSITSSVSPDGKKGILKATAAYAAFVHQGTGLYGPNKAMILIKAKNKKALFWPGAAHPVKSVKIKGQKANPFFLRAIKETDLQKSFETGLMTFLRKA